MNQVIIYGRLGKDAEVRYTNNGKPVVSFSVATSEYMGKDDQGNAKFSDTEWHDIECLGFAGVKAEGLELRKSDSVVVIGQSVTDKWEKDGKKYFRKKVKCFRKDQIILEYIPAK
jgi:single-strand DNA-binding protein